MKRVLFVAKVLLAVALARLMNYANKTTKFINRQLVVAIA
jgi:hypothetical protein